MLGIRDGVGGAARVGGAPRGGARPRSNSKRSSSRRSTRRRGVGARRLRARSGTETRASSRTPRPVSAISRACPRLTATCSGGAKRKCSRDPSATRGARLRRCIARRRAQQRGLLGARVCAPAAGPGKTSWSSGRAGAARAADASGSATLPTAWTSSPAASHEKMPRPAAARRPCPFGQGVSKNAMPGRVRRSRPRVRGRPRRAFSMTTATATAAPTTMTTTATTSPSPPPLRPAGRWAKGR